MKNAFFNRMKIVFFASLCIFCSVCFFACTNLISSDDSCSDDGKNSEEIYEIKGNLFVDGSSPKFMEKTGQDRSVSAELPNEIFYSVSAKNAENSEKTYTAEVSGSAFSIKLSKGTWNITAEGFSDAEKTLSVLKGSVSVSVEDENSVKSGISVKMSPQTDGKGNISLSLEVENGSGIKSVLAELYKNGENGSVYSEKLNFSSNAAKIEQSDVSSGVYILSLKFYSESDCSGGLFYSAQEIVNVFNNLTTDTWQGNSVYFTGGKFLLSKSAVESFKMKTFFVQGESETTYSPAKSADDSNAGTYFAPLKTVQAAVDKINALNNGTAEYTIFVDGTVEPTYADTDFNNYTFVYIKPTASNLDLTIKGLSAVSKAVLNARQNSSYKSRVLTSENTSLTLENLKITGGKVNDFGGIYIKSGNLTLKNCVVTKNESSNGGGGIHFDGENLIVENSEISENKGDSGGICVAASSAKTKIKDSNIIKNSARSGGGGLDLVGESTIEDCNITDNKAEFSTGGGGGLILAFNNKSCKIIKSVIENNIAGENGGGIYINGGTLSLESGTAINSNKAKNGGGIYINAGEAGLSDCTISSNEAFEDGGAIYASCEYSTITVNIGEKDDSDDVLIEKNKANRGGAFYGADNARFVMNAGKVSGNYSTGNIPEHGGGAMFIWGGSSTYSTFTMSGGEIIGNMAKSGGAGGAIHIDHGDGVKKSAFIMTGGLLSGNKAADENGDGSKLGGAIYVNYGGEIKLGGSAVIAAEDDGNDIWLAAGRKITVVDELSPENNSAAGNPKYTARVTLQNYASGTAIVEGCSSPSHVLTQNDCNKFKVIDDSGNLCEVKLNSSGNGEGNLGSKLALNEQTRILGVLDSVDTDLLNFAFSYIGRNSENAWTLKLNDKSVDDLQTVTVSSGMSVLLEGDESKHAQLSCPNKNSDGYIHIRVENGATLTLKNIDLKGDAYGNFCQYALFIEPGGKVILENTTVSGFKNNGNGTIYVKGELSIGEGVSINNNKARYGAGFYAVSGGFVVMNGGEITGNECVNGNKVVDIGSGSRFEWNSGTISNNKVGSAVSIIGDFVNNSGNDMS